MKHLILIATNFPFNGGDENFIKPEYAILKEKFDLKVITRNRKRKKTCDKYEGLQYKIYRHDILRVLPFMLISLFHKELYTEIHRIFKKHKGGGAFLLSYVTLSRALAFCHYLNTLQIESNSILYSYWYNFTALGIALYKKKHPNIKAITRTHGYDLYEERSASLYQPYKIQVDEILDRVCFVSQQGLDYYNARYTKGREGCHVLFRLGVNRIGVKTIFKKTDTLKIVSCSNVVEVKRVHLIVEALTLINDIKIEWTHYGDGNLMSQIKNLCKKLLDIKENIKYTLKGSTPNTQIHKDLLTNDFDIFLTTSESEGLPVSMQEALAYGISCIGTDVGGIKEIIGQDCGTLLPSNPTPEVIAKAIKEASYMTEDKKVSLAHSCMTRWDSLFNAQKNFLAFARMLEGM